VDVRETAGGVLAGIAGLIVAVSMLAVMGDTFPTHLGMTRVEGALAVRIALCPGERVSAVEVTSESEPHQTWRVAGPDSTVDTWVVGAVPPDGFVEVESAPTVAFLRGDVTVQVETNQVVDRITGVDALNVISGSVLFDNQATVSSRFAEEATRRYPCDDPDGKLGTWKWVSRFLLLAAGLAAIAALLLIPENRRRTLREDHPVGWYANPDDSTTVRWWDGKRWTAAIAVPRHSSPAARHGAAPVASVVLIVGGFLMALIAPAAGAEHRFLPEPWWAMALHRTSLGLFALGGCCILVTIALARHRRKN
jgi:hypothetical protein